MHTLRVEAGNRAWPGDAGLLNARLYFISNLPHCSLLFLFVAQALADMLVEVCKNPKSPGFNHYLFESVAALIKHGTAGQPQQLKQYEGTLFPAFNLVLQNDVQVGGCLWFVCAGMHTGSCASCFWSAAAGKAIMPPQCWPSSSCRMMGRVRRCYVCVLRGVLIACLDMHSCFDCAPRGSCRNFICV